jgi:hypothetical protein
MEAVKRFFSSPRFAVAGASNDSNKFGYKSMARELQELRGMPFSNLQQFSLGIISTHWP